MILFLLSASALCRPEYNLTQPFKARNLTDIGDWSLVGSSTPSKHFVRLTSAISDSFGGACHRKPSNSEDWSAEFEMRSRDGNGGEMFCFYFTDQFCPGKTEGWAGFRLCTNNTKNVGKSPIYMDQKRSDEGKRLLAESVGSFEMRGEDPVTVRVTRTGDKIQAKFKRGFTINNFEKNFAGLPRLGYFSMYATTSSYADNNDLLSFQYEPLSKLEDADYNNISETNRIVLLLDKETRRLKKKVRSISMQTTLEYNQKRTKKNNILDGEDANFKDVQSMVQEATLRSQMTITKDMLAEFLVPDVEKSMLKASAKIALQMERYKDTKMDMHEIWDNLRNQLRDMAIEAKANMLVLGEEAIKAAKDITLKTDAPNEEKVAQIAADENRFLPFVLICICVVEFVLYMIWFGRKRKRTHNFKKAD